MKRQKLYFSPNRSQDDRRPYKLALSVIANFFWVWCLNLDHKLKRQRSRLGLETLTEEQLRDVGLTRKESQVELKKFFWED